MRGQKFLNGHPSNQARSEDHPTCAHIFLRARTSSFAHPHRRTAPAEIVQMPIFDLLYCQRRAKVADLLRGHAEDQYHALAASLRPTIAHRTRLVRAGPPEAMEIEGCAALFHQTRGFLGSKRPSMEGALCPSSPSQSSALVDPSISSAHPLAQDK